MSNEIIPQQSGFAQLLSPATIKEAREFAEVLAKSDLVPRAYQGKPGDILIAAAMGSRLGLDIFSALAGVACVNGRPTLYGDALLAVCQMRPDFQDFTEVVTGSGDQMVATVTVTRRGRSPYTSTYSMQDAATAGLKGKQGPWMQHPKRMLTMRARAFALRGCYADALAGFHAREEFDDYEDVTHTATVVPEAKPAKARKLPERETPITESTAQLMPQQQPKDEAQVTSSPEPEKDPIVVTGADEPTVGDLVSMAQNLVKEFPASMDDIKAINKHFGIKKLGEIPVEKVREAIDLLVKVTARLAGAQ